MYVMIWTRSRLLAAAAAVALLAVAVLGARAALMRTSRTVEDKANTKTVIIDAGHGGEDGGAVGYDGTVEKGINLSISLKLCSFFKSAGYRVVMIRETDTAIYDKSARTLREKKVSDIHNRLKIADAYPGAIFISVHQNIYTSSKYSGAQVFYSVNNARSKLLAQTLQQTIRESLQPGNDRQIKPAGDNLYILYHAKIPTVLVECGFLSNPAECDRLNDGAYQNQMAFSIFSGTLAYASEAAGNS